MTVPSYILQWAGSPGPKQLLAELRARAEGRGIGARARIDLPWTPAERREIGRLLPAGWATSGAPVTIRQVRDALGLHGVALEELLEAVGGPLRDRAAERAAARAERAADHARAATLLGMDPSSRALKRCLVSAESREQRAREILRVVEAARSAGQIRLGVLAAQLFSDAHALDRNRALGRAVARYLSGQGADPEAWTDPLHEVGAWADAWAGAGVICDGVSSQVLVLNLPLIGDAPAVSLCSATPGEPIWLTLRSLTGSLTLADGVPEVYVCENPVVVEEAADRLGRGSKPLVCTFGVPSLATHRLLSALPAKLFVRADADATGWGILRGLLGRYPEAQPWRMPEGSVGYEEEILEDLIADLEPT